VRTQSVTSLLGMQECAITHIEHTHRKGRRAVIVHLGQTGRDTDAGPWLTVRASRSSTTRSLSSGTGATPSTRSARLNWTRRPAATKGWWPASSSSWAPSARGSRRISYIRRFETHSSKLTHRHCRILPVARRCLRAHARLREKSIRRFFLFKIGLVGAEHRQLNLFIRERFVTCSQYRLPVQNLHGVEVRYF